MHTQKNLMAIPNKCLRDPGKHLLGMTMLLAIGIFYVLTIRDGHDWGDDFAMYIHHAKNIAQGASYQDTGYIYNPFCPQIGPPTYPPIFPLLLAPIVKFFGINLTAMKSETIVLFVLFLATLFLVFKDKMPFVQLLAMVACVGLNPAFWECKDRILSDIPFLLFTYAAFALSLKAEAQSNGRTRIFFLATLLGLFVYAAYGTRSIGIVLLPVLLLDDILRFRRVSMCTWVACVVLLTGVLLQHKYLHNDIGYFMHFTLPPQALMGNLLSCGHYLFDLLNNGYSRLAQCALFVAVAGFSILGYVGALRNRATVLELFPHLYGAAIVLILPGQRMRYMFPLIPLFFYYCFRGIRQAFAGMANKAVNIAFWVIALSILTSYLGRYSVLKYGPLTEGVEKKESRDLFAYIRTQTNPQDVFVFRKPRALSLYTGRKASAHHRPTGSAEFWNWLRTIEAQYLVVGKPFDSDRDTLNPFIIKHAARFREVYDNPDFIVYKILD